jgi:transcriptional regulator with XRE-family HTH domain
MPRLFGEKLRRLRRHAGITQADLARCLGLASHGHITNLETGRDTPSLDLVVRVASVFNVTTDYLLRDSLPVEETSVMKLSDITQTGSAALVFGTRLRVLRSNRGWGQTELARRLGLARRGYISNLEAGRKLPSIELVLAVAELFGVTTDDLLRRTPPPELDRVDDEAK